MKLARYRHGGEFSWGVARDKGLVDLGRRVSDLWTLLASGAREDIERAIKGAETDYDFEEVEIGLPFEPGNKIICIGRNYYGHALHKGGNVPEHPSFFLRVAASLVPHGAPIVRPALSPRLDYEGELALVIGRPGRHIPPDRVFDHIAGYTCLNEGSVRDYQLGHSVAAGKNFAASGSAGPWIVTREEIADPSRLLLMTRVNGEERQRSLTDRMVFDIAAIVSYVSGIMPLETGDLIATGSPPGTGFTLDPPRWLQPGDLVEVEIEGVGVLRNPVIAESSVETVYLDA